MGAWDGAMICGQLPSYAKAFEGFLRSYNLSQRLWREGNNMKTNKQ